MNDEELFALIAPALPNRVFKRLAPMGTKEPYVIYALVTGQPQNSMCGYMQADLIHYRIDSYARTDAEAQRINARVKACLRAGANQPLVNMEQDLFEQDTRIHRVSLDVSIWR